MKRRLRRRVKGPAVLSSILLLCVGGCLRTETLPDFELTNWDGRKMSVASLRGKRTILAFTYAKCVAACPMVTQQLKTLDDEHGNPPDLNYLHISVNPSLDTREEILKHFDKHGIDAEMDPRWLFLTGDEDATAEVLADFGIEVKRTELEIGTFVEHTIKVLVLDESATPVATFDTYHWDQERMLNALRS